MIRVGARRLARGGHQLLQWNSYTTSAQYVASRAMDPTFEKLMDGYKNLLKVTAVQDLILASPGETLPLDLLSSAAQKLRLNRSAAYFLRRYPHIFSISGGDVRLTSEAAAISREESDATGGDLAAESLIRLLALSPSRNVPLRAVFRMWRELGFPDDFEESVISRNTEIFSLVENPKEKNTHLLKLVCEVPEITPVVEKWRVRELKNRNEAEVKYGFKQEFPPGMKLTKNFRSKLNEWQRLPYQGPYGGGPAAGRTKAAFRRLEKRAVGIVHEFLDLTVEKMAEVEKISQFRKAFCIDMNIRDLFLDHPGIFYLSTKGRKHTVFLREAYSGGRLVNPNPVYSARRKLLHLVLLGKRGIETT